MCTIHRWAFGLCLAISCAPVTLSQTCNLQSKALANRLQPPQFIVPNSGWYFNQALAYLDAGCLPEALRSLDKADSSIVTEKSGSRDERERKRYAQEGLREYIAAFQLFFQGKRIEAKQKLFQLVENNKTRDVYFRSTLTLASWLAEERDAQEWGRIEPLLKELSGRGFEFWQTDFLVRNHQVKVGQGQRAVDDLLQQLAGDLPIQRKLALEILLAETFFQTGRVLNAQVLISSIEEEVGAKVLDYSLRMRFLALCASIWNSVAQAGGGPYAAKRAQIYRDALVQAQSEL